MADDAATLEVEQQKSPSNDYTAPSQEQPATNEDSAAAPASNDDGPPVSSPQNEGGNLNDTTTVPESHVAAANKNEIRPVTSSSSPEELEKNRVLVKVVQLDATDCTVTCPRKLKTSEMIQYIHNEVDTEETDFFSLFFFFNSHKIFLDPEKTIVHQLPAVIKSVQPWILYYGVKFYHPDPSKLKVDHSRYLYTLQLCNDIRANRVLIDPETAKRLTGLMLQATLGDYDPEEHKEGYTQDFEDFNLIPKDTRDSDYEIDLVNYHQSKAGYSPAQAESEFCEVARKLPRYGYHLFGVQDDHSNACLVANGFHGIQIFQERERIHFFKWPNIVKISYKRRKFRIKYHPVNSDDEPDIDTIDQLKFYCGKQPASKQIWKNAVEQHTFFRLNTPDPPNRINILFRRGSRFRYSGRTLRQTMNGEVRKQHHDFQRSYSERAQKSSYESYAPGYVPSQNSFRRTRPKPVPPQQSPHQFFIEKEDQKWVQLDAPPTDKEVDQSRTEQQRVQVNFSVQDGLPEDHYKAVLKKNGGSMEVLTSEGTDDTPTYKLSAIDQNSQAILTSVSVRIDPEEGAEHGSHSDSNVVFDSTTLPSVKLNADTTTSTTVMESSGKTVSTGGVTHSYQYTMDCVDEEHSATVPDMAQDDTPETIEVELFMKKEGELLKEVLSASTTEGTTEVED